VAREDYSNRTRETLHRNWLFDDTNVTVSGQYEQVKDTFIYNQSWWTKNSNCHNHYYKLQTGVSSGHSHAFPKDREELVLGLMNRFRQSMGGEHNHGVKPGPENHPPSPNNNPISVWSAWSGAQGGAFDGRGYGNYPHNDTVYDPWHGSYYAYDGDTPDDRCDNAGGHDSGSDDFWKINGDAFRSSEGEENYEPSIDFRQIQLWDPCQYIYNDRFRDGLGLSESEHEVHAGRSDPSNGTDWCVDGGQGQAHTVCNDNGGVNCYGDFTVQDVGFNAGGRSGDCPGANWMRNQPPSLERTPFRPILLCDLRTDNNPAVPEGGFITSCKLILTVSKQSIAWPRKGFTAEVFNLVAGANENANWYSPIGRPDSLLNHDSAGHTLGHWYTTTLREVNQVPWNLGQHWLPDPIHKSIFPKETKTYAWQPDADWDEDEYDTTDGGPSPRHPNVLWKFNRPFNESCYLVGRFDTHDPDGSPPVYSLPSYYGEWEHGGLHSEQLLVGPAYDGEQSWEGLNSENPLTSGLPPYKLWEPIPWWVECGYACGNCSHKPPIGNTDGTSPNSIGEDRAVGCSAGNWHARASEVEGLTGCGGAVDVSFGGFTHDVGSPGGGQPIPHYAYDGENLNTDTSNSFGPSTHTYVPEWAPISSPNYKEFNIPKFTTTGFSGGNENLFNVEGPHGTGSTGQYDGRGITFEIELDDFARHAIANKEQKLDLLIKGEYKGRAEGSTVDAVYESASALWIKTNEIGCQECVDELYPKANSSNAPVQGFEGIDKLWKTDAAQIATNFFSVDSPAPNMIIPIHFRGKGSTVDWESGNVGGMSFHLQTTENPNKEEYIKMPKGFMNEGQLDSFTRFNMVFGKMASTDSFEILDSESYSFFDDTDGTYTPYKVEMTNHYTNVYVTGDNRLFPSVPTTSRPETINDQSARFIGTHKISLENEYYIDTYTDGAYMPMFENFYDQVESTTTLNPSSTAYPEFYSQDAMVEGGGGITGGGRDIIEVNIQGDTTHTNNGTYTIQSVYYMNIEHNINIERLRVNEKVTDQSEQQCLVRRINHRPRFEVSYRSRRQYDRPGDPAGGVPHGD